jgi:hypothetical protein
MMSRKPMTSGEGQSCRDHQPEDGQHSEEGREAEREPPLAHLTKNARTIAAVVRMVVIADFVFTTTAVILQAVTIGIAPAMGRSSPSTATYSTVRRFSR